MRSNFWLLWTIVNTVSFSVATYVSVLLATQDAFGGTLNGIGILGAGGIVGAIVGVSQECLLRQKLRGVGLWILATTVGGAIGWGIGGGVSASGIALISSWLPLVASSIYIAAAINGAFIGAVVGLAQFWVLRRSFTNVRLWIIASILGRSAGWVTATLVFSIDFPLPPTNGQVKFLIPGAVGGAVYGAITGFCLTRQLQPKPRPNSTGAVELDQNH